MHVCVCRCACVCVSTYIDRYKNTHTLTLTHIYTYTCMHTNNDTEIAAADRDSPTHWALVLGTLRLYWFAIVFRKLKRLAGHLL